MKSAYMTRSEREREKAWAKINLKCQNDVEVLFEKLIVWVYECLFLFLCAIFVDEEHLLKQCLREFSTCSHNHYFVQEWKHTFMTTKLQKCFNYVLQLVCTGCEIMELHFAVRKAFKTAIVLTTANYYCCYSVQGNTFVKHLMILRLKENCWNFRRCHWLLMT